MRRRCTIIRRSIPAALTIGIGSGDGRAVAAAEGFDVIDPFDVINSPEDPNGASDDIASNLAFNVGALGPGESTALAYYMVFATDRQSAEDLYLAQLPDPGAHHADDGVLCQRRVDGQRHGGANRR